MKFLIDAHLPRRVSRRLRSAGNDAIHTRDLPNGNRTTDREIVACAEQEDRVVITKDADFVNSHILTGRPAKLLLISTGNISNADLEWVLVPLIPVIVAEFEKHAFLELTQTGILVRG